MAQVAICKLTEWGVKGVRVDRNRLAGDSQHSPGARVKGLDGEYEYAYFCGAYHKNTIRSSVEE